MTIREMIDELQSLLDKGVSENAIIQRYIEANRSEIEEEFTDVEYVVHLNGFVSIF